jgi:hypothetical protein
MIAEGENNRLPGSLESPASWMQIWHLWTIVIPRRSITGRLVHGKVWRRHDGRRWIYKKFVEFADDRAD